MAPTKGWDIIRIINTVGNHLRKQQCKASLPGVEACSYRLETPRGRVLRCAVGCLVPKKLYTPRMEGFSVTYPTDGAHGTGLVCSILRDAGVLDDDPVTSSKNTLRLYVLDKLQLMHDGLPNGPVPVAIIDERIQHVLDDMHYEEPDVPELEWRWE